MPVPMGAKAKGLTTTITLDADLARKLARFQSENGIKSRSRAIRTLLGAGLGDPILQRAVVEGEFYFRSVMLIIFRKYSADFYKRLPEMLAEIEANTYAELSDQVPPDPHEDYDEYGRPRGHAEEE